MGGINDVIIAGAGPGGSMACKVLEKKGINVRIIDKCVHPREKPCGGVLPWRIYEIQDIPDEIIERPLSGYRIYSLLGKTATVEFPKPGAIIDRARFDDFLVKGLETEVEKYHLKGVKINEGHISLDCGKEILKARLLIAADGANSVTRRSLGITYKKMATGLQYHIKLSEKKIQEDLGNWFHIHYRFTRGYGWIVPLKDTVKVGMGGLGPQFHRAGLNRFVNDFSGDILKGGKKIKYEAHRIPMAGPMENPSLGRILFAGDAGGFVFPGTGEGIFFGMKSGMAAGETAAQILEGGHIEPEKIKEKYNQNLKSAGLLALREGSVMEGILGSRESAERYVNKIRKLVL